MAVSVDTVYQKVLAILNKEQRGYLTPEEFNLFANQAQLDIFEQYFYDVEQFGRLQGNSTEYSDMLDLLNEKISLFEKLQSLTYSSSTSSFTLPSDMYRLGTVIYDGSEVERVSQNEYLYISSSPLAKPTNSFPVYTRDETNSVKILGDSQFNDSFAVKCTYVKKPLKVVWNYTSVLGNAQYTATGSVDFGLHPSDEPELVIKILSLAGVLVRDLSIYELASQEEIKEMQQQKS